MNEEYITIDCNCIMFLYATDVCYRDRGGREGEREGLSLMTRIH